MTVKELYEKCAALGVENLDVEIKIEDLQNEYTTYTQIEDVYFSLLDNDVIVIACFI